MTNQLSISVFCSSKSSLDPIDNLMAFDTGKLIASLNLHLLYGGSDVGLMGQLAQGALLQGGLVTGVHPTHLKKIENPHKKLTHFIEVQTMSERKKYFYDHSQIFLILPGGFGTLDEFNELMSLLQVNAHSQKKSDFEPLVILFNFNQYYDDYLQFLKNGIKKGLIEGGPFQKIKIIENLFDLKKELLAKIQSR